MMQRDPAPNLLQRVAYWFDDDLGRMVVLYAVCFTILGLT